MPSTDPYDYIPAGVEGKWKIEKTDLKQIFLEETSPFEKTWMSNNASELSTHDEYIKKAHGDILLGGLGLGYDVLAVRNKGVVDSIDVVEIDTDVIKLVYRYVNSPKTRIVNDNLSGYMRTTSRKYDLIYIDVFDHDIKMFPKAKKILDDLSVRILKPRGEIMYWETYQDPPTNL